MAFYNGFNLGAYNGWFCGYNLGGYAATNRCFYNPYGYDLSSYLYHGNNWLNNGWNYDAGWDYQQLLTATSLDSCDSLSSAAAASFSSSPFQADFTCQVSPLAPTTAPSLTADSTYDYGASLNLAEFKNLLSASNLNSALSFNSTKANGKVNGNCDCRKVATPPVALPTLAPAPAPVPLKLAPLATAAAASVPAPAPQLWSPAPVAALPLPQPLPPQPPVAASSLVLQPLTFAPLAFLQTGLAAKTASIKETKPTKSRKETAATKSTKETKSTKSTRETSATQSTKEKSEPTKSSKEEDKLQNLKLIKEILEANRPHRLKRDDSLSFEDVLDFYEWLREKKRRINLAKLF